MYSAKKTYYVDLSKGSIDFSKFKIQANVDRLMNKVIAHPTNNNEKSLLVTEISVFGRYMAISVERLNPSYDLDTIVVTPIFAPFTYETGLVGLNDDLGTIKVAALEASFK